MILYYWEANMAKDQVTSRNYKKKIWVRLLYFMCLIFRLTQSNII